MEDNLYFSWRVRVLAFGMVVVRRILWLPRVSSSKPTPKTVQVSYITLALLIFELAVAAIYLLYWLVSTELFVRTNSRCFQHAHLIPIVGVGKRRIFIGPW